MKRLTKPKHLEFIRTLPCIICGHHGTEAAHIRASSSASDKVNPGIGRKADDCHVTPLCNACHERQHSGNEIAFWESHGFTIDGIIKIAERLYQSSGNSAAAQRIMLNV